MIDMHYDLLSVIYQSYLRMDYKYLEEFLSNYNSDNVSGVIANMYFMNREEMREELGEIDEINVYEMFKRAISIYNKYDLGINTIFSIEGCDYIKGPEELEDLYNIGLRNILLVWNNPNKYGSGVRGDYGLTDEGRELIKENIK